MQLSLVTVPRRSDKLLLSTWLPSQTAQPPWSPTAKEQSWWWEHLQESLESA